MELSKDLLEEEAVINELNATVNHGIYVSNLASALGRELGLSEQECYGLSLAGLLHDIGKIRASRLMYVEKTEHDFVVKEINYLRKHPFLGFEILRDKEEYSDFVLDSILFHHENYDGSGYPANLFADAIPLGARILRICDVYAALTTKKAYRPAHSKEAAIKLMISDVKNFDMKIFLKFMNMIDDRDMED